MGRLLCCLLTGALLVGCGGGGKDNREEACCSCVLVSTEVLGLDDVVTIVNGGSEVPITGREVLAVTEGERRTTFEYIDGPVTDLTIDIVQDGEVRHVDYGFDDERDLPAAPEAPPDCSDVVEVDVDMEFTTADGVFAERWPTWITASVTPSGVGAFRHELNVDPEDVGGTYEVPREDLTVYTEAYLRFWTAFAWTVDDETPQGELWFRGMLPEDEGGAPPPDEFPVGTWGGWETEWP